MGQQGIKMNNKNIFRASAHMGDRGGCSSPSVQKPIPSPRAKNQGPSKKLGQERQKIEIFENIILIFVVF